MSFTSYAMRVFFSVTKIKREICTSQEHRHSVVYLPKTPTTSHLQPADNTILATVFRLVHCLISPRLHADNILVQ